MPSHNPRAACLTALRRWREGREFADAILHESLAAASLSPLDRAFFMDAFYGVLRNLSALDFFIARLRDGTLEPPVRDLLRLGLYQIFYMRVPDHAAVNEAVELAGSARGLVNAILRRAIREHEDLSRRLDNQPIATRFSHPQELVRRWENAFGQDRARELCQWNNTPAEIFIRANGLKVTRGELLRSDPDAVPVENQRGMLKTKRIPMSWIVNGLGYVQDPSTLIACELLDAKPGEAILDACAAPGGKTSYIAQQLGGSGSITACDVSQPRLTRLEHNLQRLGVTNTKTFRQDWLAGGSEFAAETFDRVLLDAPCSNTGVIRRRIDVRWRVGKNDFEQMPRKQFAILEALVPLVKKGGAIVYSTCSLEPEENEILVRRVSDEISSLRFVESRQSLPFRDKIDGAFAAKFVRA